MNRSKPMMLALTLVCLMVAPTPAAAFEPDEKAICLATIAHTQMSFEAFGTSGIPESLVRIEMARVYDACYRPPTIVDGIVDDDVGGDRFVDADALVDVDGLLKKKACAGGGSTLMGWNDEIVLLGEPYSILRGPASSHWAFTETEDGWLAVGHSRSTLNNIERSEEDGLWQFAGIPMGGTISLSGTCVGPLVTSVATSASGTPLAIPIIDEDVLYVTVGGRTCLIPC